MLLLSAISAADVANPRVGLEARRLFLHGGCFLMVIAGGLLLCPVNYCKLGVIR